MSITEYSNREKNTLLYVESCCVDYGGRLHVVRMNAEDDAAISRFVLDGIVLRYGRIKHGFVNRDGAKFIELSDAGYELAWQVRRARAERLKLDDEKLTQQTRRVVSGATESADNG